MADDHGFGAETAHEMLAGGIAGLSEHFFGFPFDTVKTRMQESHKPFGATISHMISNEPWRNFYRGCGPVLACSFPAHAAYFSLYESAKRVIGADSSAGYVVASVAATIGHDTVSVPFDVVKQHMQVDGHRAHLSSAACLRAIIRDHGALSLVKALPTTISMNIPHMATQWVVYEAMKKKLGLGDEETIEPKYIVAGLTAGGAAAAVSTPLDVIKTRLQLMRSPGFIHAIGDIWRDHGLRGFGKGLGPRMAAMAPSAAVVLTTYEAAKVLLKPIDTVVGDLFPVPAAAPVAVVAPTPATA